MAALRRRCLIVSIALAVASAATALAFALAVRQLHRGIEQALGPRATVDSVSLVWAGVELRGLRVAAQPGRWPAAVELSAARVLIVPSVSSLWRRGWHVHSVTIEGAGLTSLRTREGRLQVLPSLLDRGVARDAAAATPVHVGAVHLRDVQVDFHDASVAGRGRPHRIRLSRLRADVGPLAWPALDARSSVTLLATLQGPQRHGTLALNGWLTPATRQADLALKLDGVDLVAFSPYLLRANDTRVRRGTIDLTLTAHVTGQQLRAPGRMTLIDLDLASASGALGQFAGVPRQAVLAAISRDGRLDLDFSLDGRLDDPRFSVNELFAARFAVGLADTLGVRLGNLAQGIGSVVKGLFGR